MARPSLLEPPRSPFTSATGRHRVMLALTGAQGCRGPKSGGHDTLGKCHLDPFLLDKAVSRWSSEGPPAGAAPSRSKRVLAVGGRRLCTGWPAAL